MSEHTREQAAQIIADWEKQLESCINDACEKAYWQFDARKKGYAEWEGMPQSERDAFKQECYMMAKRYILDPEHDVCQTFANDLIDAQDRIAELEQKLAESSSGCKFQNEVVVTQAQEIIKLRADYKADHEKWIEYKNGHKEQLAELESKNRGLVKAAKQFINNLDECETSEGYAGFEIMGGYVNEFIDDIARSAA